LKAKKSFGQHFLTREDIANKIAESIDKVDKYPRVLEIGPGMGMLTKYLLNKPYALQLCEADKDMVTYLVEQMKIKDDTIYKNDFLKLDLNKVFGGEPFIIIGNFPYNISSQIIFKMLDDTSIVPQMVGMFQKEMAERVVAPPGSKTYGVISVLTQAFYDCEYLFTVDKNCFNPPPKVQSAVIRLNRKDVQTLECDPIAFKKIVKQAFGQRRKMMRNTLKSLVSNEKLLENEIFNKRPETLSYLEFVDLTNMLMPNI
jgi:16S rRNA (adenine1518-N6/adenine1519-N6)-dimethyltransferase